MSTNQPHGTPSAPETREETIDRVSPAEVSRDPSSRRRLGTKAVVLGHATALVAGALTFVIALLLDGSVPLALGIGGGVALGVGVLSTLLLAESEDGRVEEMVETKGSRFPE